MLVTKRRLFCQICLNLFVSAIASPWCLRTQIAADVYGKLTCHVSVSMPGRSLSFYEPLLASFAPLRCAAIWFSVNAMLCFSLSSAQWPCPYRKNGRRLTSGYSEKYMEVPLLCNIPLWSWFGAGPSLLPSNAV